MWRLLLLFLVLFVPFSFFGCEGTDHTQRLSYQEYPLNERGILTYDGRSYEVMLSVKKAGDLKLEILSPEQMAGMVLELSDGKSFLRFDSVTAELGSEAYAAKEGVLLAAKMFSLSSSDYDGAGIVTENQVRYSYINYEIDSGRVTVYIPDGASKPSKMKAELNGHSFVFEFVNES